MPLTQQQKQLLMIGAPVVAGFALINAIKGKASASASATTPAGPPQGYTLPIAPSTDAIGVGQLSQWEDLIGKAIGDLGANLTEQVSAIPTTSTTDPALLSTLQQIQTQLTQQPSTSTSSTNCTPKFPWHMSNGILVDNYTGRPAYYGAQSQPGAPYNPGELLPSGWSLWTMPDGRQCKYDPNNWNYLDPSRPPVCH